MTAAGGDGCEALTASGGVEMLTLHVLGGFRVVQDGRDVSELTAQPGRAALLVFLALERTTTRDAAVALLWPEHDALKARHALSQTLHRLRGALGEEWLETAGERLSIAPSVDVDALAFEELVESGEYGRALGVYPGPFLPGWFLADSPAFELWVDRRRAHLERAYRHACREWIRTRRERGDVAAALRAAQRWVEIDPQEDEAQHRLIELLAESGHRVEALRQFALYRRLLEKEELKPLDETVELVARLRQAADVGPLADEEAGVGPATPAASAAAAAVPAAGADDSLPVARPAQVSAGRSPLARVAAYVQAHVRRRALRVIGLVAALALVVVLAVVGWRVLGRRPDTRATLQPGGRVLLADFDNGTRDTLLSSVVTEALRIDLQRHLHSAVVDPGEVGRVLARMRRAPDAPLTVEIAREAAVRAGIPAVVGGRIGAVGPGYVLSGWIVAVPNGRILDAALATAHDSTELIQAIGELSRQLLKVIRPSLADLPAPAPLERVTTSSLEALRKYSAATRIRREQGEDDRAARLLREAVGLDSTFAMAHRALGSLLLNTGAPRRAWSDALSAAYRHRDRLTDPERYVTIAAYHQYVSGEMDEAIQAYEDLLELDSVQTMALNNLGVLYRDLRDYPRAETMLRRCVAADSLVYACAINLSGVVHVRGQNAEALALVQRAMRLRPDYRTAREQLVWIAATEQDYDRADSMLAAYVRGQPASLGLHQWEFGLFDAVRGRASEARRHFQDFYRVTAHADPAQANRALRELAWLELMIRHDTAAGLAAMDRALRDSSMRAFDSSDVPYLHIAAFYLAAGRAQQAGSALSAFLARVPPEARALHDRRLYAVRGRMAMRQGRFDEAAEAFRIADTRLGSPFLVLQYLGPLHESAGRPDSAIAAYERYLSTGWIDRMFYDARLLPDVLEHLATLYERQGKPAEAARYYNRFADLWAGADPELQPRVAAARRRAQLLRNPVTPGAPAPARRN